MTINQAIKIFFPVFKDRQLQDYADLMMGLNNHLVDVLDSNPSDIYLLENNKWTPICDASFDSVYALWYAFFGIMKVEFELGKDKIEALKSKPTADNALGCYAIMHKVMTSITLDHNAIDEMQNKFPAYAHKFNELRKLIYLQTIAPQSTMH
jgi:hypothetical protein